MLGFCVFGWGLRYKLSLYDPPHSVNRHMPEAKLLSGKERAALVAVDLRQMANTKPPLVLATTAFAFLLALAVMPSIDQRLYLRVFADPRGAPQSVPRLTSSIRPPPRRH